MLLYGSVEILCVLLSAEGARAFPGARSQQLMGEEVSVKSDGFVWSKE